jgi:PAS domain-containing protein
MNPDKPISLHLEEKLFSSSYLFTVDLDEKQQIISTNPKLGQELKFAGPKLIGSHFSDYFFPEDFSKYQFLLENTQSQKGRSFTSDLRMLRRDGIDFEWSKWEFFIQYSGKNLTEITGIGHKILPACNEKNKTEAQIQQQQKLLENITFYQSHGLRARLANILGILELIGNETNSESNGNLLEMLKSEAQKLDNALKQGIALSVNMNTSIK